jgi:CheY-like chemotaxis protein
MRGFLRTVLSKHGFRVHVAATEEQGISHASMHNPDFIVLGLGLPEIDGVRVTTRLRTWTSVPIMILSVHGRESQKVAAFRAGANDYVTKPFFTSELLRRRPTCPSTCGSCDKSWSVTPRDHASSSPSRASGAGCASGESRPFPTHFYAQTSR